MALVNRDPFAREELHRRSVVVFAEGGGCAWCGAYRSGLRNPQARRLFQYRIETDGGRVSEDAKLFCSKSCRDSYHS